MPAQTHGPVHGTPAGLGPLALAQLLRLRTLLGGSDRHLRICNLGDAVWSVFMVTGLDKVFEFFPNQVVAIASLQIEKASHESPNQ